MGDHWSLWLERTRRTSDHKENLEKVWQWDRVNIRGAWWDSKNNDIKGFFV